MCEHLEDVTMHEARAWAARERPVATRHTAYMSGGVTPASSPAKPLLRKVARRDGRRAQMVWKERVRVRDRRRTPFPPRQEGAFL